MTVRIGINGFGRIGRLALRSLWPRVEAGEVEIARINDPGGDAATFAHLTEFDSVHGHWSPGSGIAAEDEVLSIDDRRIAFSANRGFDESDWSACDVVIEASGVVKKSEQLAPYFDQGVARVVVTAPLKDADVLNVVVGVNDDKYDPDVHRIVTAASCTTNCLAPV
nr:type I glyceraldehyde-3-phosphate dehydrogenase [Gammaproteobacteria bacterium]